MPSITKPCHNCRRRRLRCDRSWPTCHKCAVSGQECLGYGKVFIWTEAIDAQGNKRPPLGRNHSTGSITTSTGTFDVNVNLNTTSSAGAAGVHDNGFRPGRGRETDLSWAHTTHHQNEDDAAQQAELLLEDLKLDFDEPPSNCQDRNSLKSNMLMDITDEDYFPDASSQGQSQNLSNDEGLNHRSLRHYSDHQKCPEVPQEGMTTKHSSSSHPTQPFASELIAANLTDPVFQDLDRNSRYYLAHFADRVCQDLVARDAPGSNPFRELIPLTNKHPLLLQILVATSAIHWSNIFRPITAIPTGLSDPGGYLALLRSKDLVSRQALIDALTAKQKAMGHLREVLDTLDPAGSEVALAAMHFFIKFDLIDLDRSDVKSWKAHLEGASSILAFLTPGNASSASSRMLRDCIIADCFIYHILGSTLASGGLATQIAKYAFELLPVMKRVEVNSYLSCPPEILQVILLASQLSYDTPCTDWSLSAADQALALIDQALEFDIAAWANQLRQLPNVGDIESRIHVASAHRSAACLYILQALPLARAVRPVDTNFLVGDILSHLSYIGETDPYFKATSWPTFIAGAETRDAEKRTWSMKRLLAIWDIIPWGYIFTAIEMLKATWQMQDTSPGTTDVNWLQNLRGVGFDHLIV